MAAMMTMPRRFAARCCGAAAPPQRAMRTAAAQAACRAVATEGLRRPARHATARGRGRSLRTVRQQARGTEPPPSSADMAAASKPSLGPPPPRQPSAQQAIFCLADAASMLYVTTAPAARARRRDASDAYSRPSRQASGYDTRCAPGPAASRISLACHDIDDFAAASP